MKLQESHTPAHFPEERLTVARHTEIDFGLMALLLFPKVRSKAQRGRGSLSDPGETGKTNRC